MIYAGAAKTNSTSIGGLFRSGDGTSWERVLDENTYAITLARNAAYAATQSGVYRSTGHRWEHLPIDQQTWSVFAHPKDPRLLYAGTSPTGVWRSEDGGDTWRPLKAAMPERVKMAFP